MTSAGDRRDTASTVAVIDDAPAVRQAMSFTVEDAGWTAWEVEGPLRSLSSTVRALRRSAGAALCDHRLREGHYASFVGAELAASLYDVRIPTVLCTTYSSASQDELRPHLRKIPVVLPIEFDADSLHHGLQTSKDELDGRFLPTRRPWRTLVHVVEFDRHDVYVRVPVWHVDEKVRLPRDVVPLSDAALARERRYYAAVNVGAQDQKDLYFSEWELG